MEITFYNYNKEIIVLNKKSYLTNDLTITGNLRNNCDILNPVITFTTTQYLLYNYNYAYIKEFNRYYFITNFEFGINNLITIYFKVDVLNSYTNSILSLNAYVTRNENTFNSLIEDNLVEYEYRKNVSLEEAEDWIFTYHTPFITDLNSVNDYNIIVNVINDKVVGRGFQYQDSFGKLPKINFSVTGDYCNSDLYIITSSNLWRLSKACLDDDTIPTFIKSIMIFPFIIPIQFYKKPDGSPVTQFGEVETTLAFNYGKKTIEIGTNRYGNNLGSFFRLHYCTLDVPFFNKYTDLSPYTNYELYIPYVGNVELKIEEINDCVLDIFYNINLEDGSAICYIYNTTKGYILYETTCSLGVSFSLSSTNNREVTNQRINQGVSLGLGAITSAITIGGGIMTGNPVGVVIGASQLGATIGKSVSGFNSIYEKGQIALTSGTSSLQLPQECYVKITRVIETNNQQAEFRKLYGKPLNKNVYLNTLTGFTKIDNIHLEGTGFENITYQEKQELENLLKNGIII